MSTLASLSQLKSVCRSAAIIPVITIRRLEDAVPMAEALLAGGLKVLEVTLRTPVALSAIEQMRKVSGVVVGAGTILNPEDMRRAEEHGAEFGVSPGATPQLLSAASRSSFPMLMGVSTASEVMHLLSHGFDFMKFFPAEANGGTSVLKSYAPPLSAASFCPTGGIDASKVGQYLDLPNVVCVGGGWMLRNDLIERQDWQGVTECVRQAVLAVKQQ